MGLGEARLQEADVAATDFNWRDVWTLILYGICLMSNPSFFLTALVWVSAVLPFQGAPPNIVFILCDDLGYGDLGLLFQNGRAESGEPYHRTPNLDRMAGEGLQLRRHYVPAPVCAPSRASLLTGVHQGHATVRDNQFDKALEDNHTLGTVLQRAGYATAIIGKWGLQGDGDSPESWEAYPTKRGFDYFFGYVRHRDGHNHYPAHEVAARPPVELYSDTEDISDRLAGCYTTDLFTAEAKRWIIAQKQEHPAQPFFLYLAYDAPHAGLEVAAAPYPDGGGLTGGVQWLGEEGRMINTAEESIDDYVHPDYADQDWPDASKRFASMVRRIDSAVGDLLQLLRDLGIDNETLIVFTSDNGPHAESYGYGDYSPDFFDSFGPLDGIKRDTWEGGIRVPTLIRWPGKIPAAERDDTPSQFHDWMPTFADLAGLPAPARTDGVSLVPMLTREGEQRAGKVYIEYQVKGQTPAYQEFHESRRKRHRGQMQVLYLDGYKGVRYGIQSAEDDFQIFETVADPGERTNLAGKDESFRDLQRRMKDRALQLRRPETSAKRPYDSDPVPALETPADLKPGLRYRIYEVGTPWTPDIETLDAEVAVSGVSRELDLAVLSRRDDVVLEYAGFLRVPETGEYSFTVAADRGASLRVHGALLIDADKDYEGGTERSATIRLEEGDHPFRLVYARGGEGNPFLALECSGPNFARSEITDEFLFYRP